MKIKHKTAIIGSLTVIWIVVSTLITFNLSYFGYIDKDKEKRVKRNFEIIKYMINKDEDRMQSLLIDWGQWDDTYYFMDDLNQEYIDSNLPDVTLENLDLTNIIYLNNEHEIVYSKETGIEKESSQAFVSKLLTNHKNFDENSVHNTGLIELYGKVYTIGTLPITSSEDDTPSKGTLIMVSEVGTEDLDFMEQIVNANIIFKSAENEKFMNKKNIVYLDLNGETIEYRKDNSDAVKVFKDINGEDAIAVKTIEMSTDNEAVLHFFKVFIYEFLGLFSLALIFDIFVINRYILKRLEKVINFIKNVAKTKDTKLTLQMNGNDEYSELAQATNNMLERINSANEEIMFLSYSDKLTGLKNRAYMEKLFVELDKNKEENYFIIMADLNGLKLTNDALGHVQGDLLLNLISRIFIESCEPDDEISRWGGDEFVILTKNKSAKYVFELVDKIKEKCGSEKTFHFEISVACGYAGSHEESSGTEAVMSMAEMRMYRNKLLENQSARSAAINSLSRTLHEKHSETEEHTIRLKHLSVKLGKRLGLTREKLDELELLSSLHDIGKIGIPEHILMKPGKLDEEEWEIMKSHAEIGYRIASSTPELAHIANKILSHHERYDGTGYPNRLKGEEIPLLSRIINIIDSFDVMTHKRVYKDEAFGMEHVIEELKRCSGGQFDPYLVEEFIKMLEEENII